MEITFIGTGSGQTVTKRNHSSILIKSVNHNILIDAGDGISKALLNLGIGFDSIDSIVFTHHHADHFSGIASLITQMKLVNRTKPLGIFTHKNLTPSVAALLNSVYMFNEILGFDLTINGFETGEKISLNNYISFITKKNLHIFQKENLKQYPPGIFVSSSFLFELEGKTIFYTSDIGSKDDLYLFEDQKIDYFITESTHTTLEDIYKALGKVDPEKLFITHIDEKVEQALEKWYSDLNENKKEKVIICYDGYSFKTADDNT